MHDEATCTITACDLWDNIAEDAGDVRPANFSDSWAELEANLGVSNFESIQENLGITEELWNVVTTKSRKISGCFWDYATFDATDHMWVNAGGQIPEAAQRRGRRSSSVSAPFASSWGSNGFERESAVGDAECPEGSFKSATMPLDAACRRKWRICGPAE